MHKSNPHIDGYDMQALAKAEPALSHHLIKAPSGRDSINFSDPEAVKLLNKALLLHHYNLEYWDIPKGQLCPPIPGRADYMLGLNDVLNQSKAGNKEQVSILDVGTGANLIYPIIGKALFNWNWVASDINQDSIINAQAIIDNNPSLIGSVSLRHQPNNKHIFKGIIESGDYFDASVCNPPFHRSAAEALAGSAQKNKNLNRNKNKRQSNVKKVDSSSHLNFSGQANELWCEGGEFAFISNMINESRKVASQVGLFSCLVSKKENLKPLAANLKKVTSIPMNIHEMAQGNKISRFITWHF